MPDAKIYVPVQAAFAKDGTICPVTLTWENGVAYHIDNVTDVRPAVAAKAGGRGDRYTVHINGKQSYLYFERNQSFEGNNIGRWFVEKKNTP